MLIVFQSSPGDMQTFQQLNCVKHIIVDLMATLALDSHGDLQSQTVVFIENYPGVWLSKLIIHDKDTSIHRTQ